MKRFITTVLGVTVFFLAVGAIVEKTSASFKSDEKALSLIRAARQAIGGDSSVAGVQSLRIVGQTTQTFKVNGTDKVEQGETEIALMLPDKLMKTIKIGHDDGTGQQQKIESRQVDVVVTGQSTDRVNFKGEGDGQGGQVFVFKKGDGDVQEVNTADGKQIIIKKRDGDVQEVNTADGKKIIIHKVEGSDNVEFRTADPDGAPLDPNGKQMILRRGGHEQERNNELLRLTLGLLLSAPQGMDVSYTYGGESSVDGTACNIVVADFAGSSVKIFLNRDSNLPVMLSYSGTRMPKIITFDRETAPPAGGENGVVVFRKAGPGEKAGESAEFQVRFSDYRSVNGVQLPYRWTTNADGALDETFDVTSYEVNPANIAEKFQHDKVFIRSKKPDGQ
ncbi:MAG: hypothetical protein ABI999_03855 [Acidobacteriota bacterium]